MKKFTQACRVLLTLTALIALLSHAGAQPLSGTKAIPGDYATIALAVDALNMNGVAAPGVTFNVAAGHLETIAATISLTTTGTAAAPIVFQKSGAGANPVLTSYTGGTGTPGTAVQDGIWRLVGADYVTIDGIDLMENAANTANPATMEYGYALYKASATDGCQYNVIKNCTITLNRVNSATGTAPAVDGSRGIDVMNALPTAATTVVTVTSAAGSNSYNDFYSNTIQNCNIGMALIGFADATPFALADTDNDVGGSSASTGNTIKNYGGGTGATTAAAAVRTLAQYGINVSYNTVNNNDGGGVNHVSTLRGIYLNTATSASATITYNTVTIHGGGTTSQVAAIENVSGSTPANNSVVIDNNTVDGDYLTATTGVFYGIYNQASPATLNIRFNTVNDLSYSVVANTGTGVVYGIFQSGSNAAMTANITNNTVDNITRTGTTGGTTIGIYNSGSLTGFTVNVNTNTVSNLSIDGTGTSSIMYGIQTATGTITVNGNMVNNLRCLKTTGTGAMYGIYNISLPVNENYNNNDVHTLLHSGTGITYGINANTAAGTRTVSGNLIYNLSTGGTTIAGMAMASSSPNIFKNKIYDVVSTSAGAPTVSGIIVSSVGTSGTANVYNNLIGDLRAPSAVTSAVGSPTIRGINITATTATSNFNLSFNTVYLNATSTGASFGTTALWATTSTTATTASLTLKNNIFVNASTPAGSGYYSAAYQRSSSALDNYNTASNYNLFHAEPSSATNVIFFDGTTAQQTLANFQTLVTPRETASITGLPDFLNTATGSGADYLHIDPTTATQIESGGTPVSGITTDFDGDTRNVTTPDIGGDEFAGIPIDMVAPTITYTALPNYCGTGARTLTATITDASGVPTSGIGLPVLYWKINSGTYDDVTAVSLGGNQYEFTFGAGSVTSDTIRYYIVAQDIVTPTPNVGAFPSAGASGPTFNPPTMTVPPTTPSSYINLITLSGTKTVGTGGDYATLTAAVADYNSKCLSGPVTFSLIDANYSTSETFPIVLNSVIGSSATNTLTIKPTLANTVITGFNNSGAMIKLNGADYVIIDGSMTSGGTTRDLVIANTTSTTTGNAVLWLAAPASGNGANNNTIKNCIIEGVASTTTTCMLGTYVGGNATLPTSLTALTAAGLEKNDNNTITNNLYRKLAIGLAMFGYAGATPDLNNVVSNNNVGGTGSDGLSFEGIHADRQSGFVVSGNEVQNIVNSTTTSNMFGIRLLDFKNGQAYNNKVHDMLYTGASTPKLYGIAVSSSTYTTAGNPSNAQIYNNWVYKINSSGISGVWNVTGILAGVGYGDKYYYNSIDLSGQINNASSGLSAAFANGDGNIGGTATNVDIRNNIMNLTGSSLGGNVWAFYTTATSYAGNIQNYNVLRCAGTGATNNTGRLNAVNYTTLAAWQAATSLDLNSFEFNPQYQSTTDLHISTTLATPVESAATPVSVTVDIDGNTRNATTPDIGSDEGNFVMLLANDMRASAFVTPANNADVAVGVAFAPVATFENSGTAAQTNVPVRYRIVNSSMVEVYNQTGTIASIAPGATANVTFTPDATLASAGTYSIYAKSENPGDQNTANDELVGTINALAPLSGTYNVGTGQPTPFNTLTGAVNRLNGVGVSGPVVFNLTDAAYNTGTGETFPIVINQFAGGSSTNTVTIKPQGTTTISHSQVASTCIIRLNGADYVILDGSISGGTDRSLTIENTNTTNLNTACVCVQSLGTGLGATNNTLKNLNLRGGSTTVTSTFGIHVAGTTVSTSAAADDNDNLTILNNSIYRAHYGIYAAATLTGYHDNMLIQQNSIGSATAAEYVGRYGLYLVRLNTSTVSQNTIFNIISSLSFNPTGMHIGAGVANTNISRNNVNNVKYIGTGGYGGKGISVTTAATGSNLTIANNFVYDILGDGYNTWGDAIVGIQLLASTGGVNIYYNTVVLSGSISRSAATGDFSAALNVQSGATGVDVRNNIFINSIENTTGVAKAYAIAQNSGTNPFTTIDHNNYFASGAEGVLGLFNTTDHATLASWAAATTQDANSESIQPAFVSATDLHLANVAANLPLDGDGTPIGGVTVDYDGATRDATTPDIGGDEVVLETCTGTPNPGNTIASSTQVCPTETVNFSLQNTTAGIDVTYQWQSSPDNMAWSNIGGATSATYSTMVGANTYFRCNVTCPTSGQTTASTSVLVNSGPLAGTTASTANPVCSGATFTLSLTGATTTGVTHQWQSSPDGMAWTDISGAMSATYVATQTVATYYRCVVTCGSSANSTPLLVNLTTDACLCAAYCTAGATSTSFEKISNVLFNTINNSSTSTAGYENFTTVSTSVEQGSIHAFTGTISGGFSGDEIIVWIDFNQDGDFTDPGEEVFNSPTGVGPHTGNITISSTATLGTTRMRVRMHDTGGSTPNATPCGDSDYGQVEDYCLTVIACTPPTLGTPATTLTQPTCAVPTGTIVVNASGSGTLEYNMDGGTFQSSNSFSGLTPGDHTFIVRFVSNPTCTVSGMATINAVPTAPTVSNVAVTHPTCAVPTGTIVVTSSPSTGVEYSNDGGTSWQASATFSGLAPGSSHNIQVRLTADNTCVGIYGTNPVGINAAPTAPSVTNVAVTQPTCAVPTGTIVVTSSPSTGVEYSSDGGTSWQASATFSGLAPSSTHNIQVRLTADNTCVGIYGTNPVNINAAPTAPSVTNVAVTQPTCAVPTGTIVVTSNPATGVEYSNDGGTTWQASATFSGLAPNSSHNIQVRLTADNTCVGIYGTNPVNINATPTAPSVTNVAVTQPTCAVPTGTIVVTSSPSTGVEYSNDGGTTWQASATFSGLAPNSSHNIQVRLTADNTCVGIYGTNPVNINATPTAPSVTNVAVTQPTCAVPTGTIVVTSNPATGVEYSKDGGTTWQASATFSGLAPSSSHNIQVRLTADNTCVGTNGSNPVAINAVPTAPSITNVAVTQPTCGTPMGTIVVTASGSGSLEYSANNGTNWQSSATFSLAPGSYNIKVRLASSPTCETAYVSNPVELNAGDLPVVTAPTVTQPTCALPTGTIVVNASGTGTLEYSVNGGTSYQPSATFSGLAPGNYNIRVRLVSDPTCATNYASNPVVLVTPSAPTVNAPTVTQPTCGVTTGTIVVNATGGSGTLEYSVNDGTSYQPSATFSGLAPGNYNIKVRVVSDPTCVTTYASNPVVINSVPTPPTVNAPTVTQPTCGVPTGTIVVNTSGGTVEYSVNNGTSYQASATFSGLAPGSYNIKVRLVSDPTCMTSYASNPVVLSAGNLPTVTAPTVTQPTCAVPTGTIVVNASGTGTLEYSVNGGTSYQPSATFSGLAPGSYNIRVRLVSDPTCATNYASNPVVLATPSAPTVNAPTVTQPTCGVPTGTIVVNATGGSGTLEYSINGGTSYQPSATFSGLAPGSSHNIRVRVANNPTCFTDYASNPVAINSTPSAPTVSAPTVTQPTCATPTGTIVVNASAGVEYSIDNGTSYQPSATFSGLAPGSYTIKVRLIADNTCMATYAGNPVVINAITNVSSAGAGAPTCNSNGTASDPADDRRVFTLNPTGSNLGATYTVSVNNGGTVSPTSGTYGSATTFTMQTGSAGNGTTYVVTVTDASGSTCTATASISDPGTCSGACNLANAGFGGLDCNNNGTSSNETDDRRVFTLNPTGVNLGATYTVSVNNGGTVSPTSGTYGSATTFMLQAGSAGNGTTYVVTVTDASGTPCTATASVSDPGSCSGACGVNSIAVSNISGCDNSGTPMAGDDTFTANVTVTYANKPSSGFLKISGDGVDSIAVGSIGATSYTFVGVQMTADGTAISLTANFTGDPTCTMTNSNAGAAPASCSGGICLVVINGISTTPECSNFANGTITIDAIGTGTLLYSIDGGVSFNTSPVFNFLQDGTYNIVVKVQGSPTCQTTGTATVASEAMQTWYRDMDNDGYSPGATQQSCTQPAGHKLLADLIAAPTGANIDCNDNDPNQKPGQTWYKDTDNDGYSNGTIKVQCTKPAGYKLLGQLNAPPVSPNVDCNDNNSNVKPGAAEICNGVDDNCDNVADNGAPTGQTFVGNKVFTSQAQVNAWPACYSVIQGSVTIQNSGINNLTPLANIVKITGNLSIKTTNLTSVKGLQNLAKVGGSVNVSLNNLALTGLDSLYNLDTVGVDFRVFQNSKLTSCCAIYELVNELPGKHVGGATISVYSNKTTCLDIPAINTACDPNFTEPGNGEAESLIDVTGKNVPAAFTGTEEQALTLFPNPATEELTVQLAQPFEFGRVKIYNLQGHLVMTQEMQSASLRHQFLVGTLPHGAYLVSVVVDGQTFTERLVVME